LADNRLYEIKRRFHSLVQHQHGVIPSSPLIQGDPMANSSLASDVGSNGTHSGSVMDSNNAAGLAAASRQVISQSAFRSACSRANEELGHGGYLPSELAALVFGTGLGNVSILGTSSFANNHPAGWGLYQVINFGCIAVRHDSSRRNDEDTDLPILRFLFAMFQLSPHNIADNYNTSIEMDEDTDKHVLTRRQIAAMLWHLTKYVEFRVRADTSPLLDDENAPSDLLGSVNEDFEKQTVSFASAVSLGLVQSAPNSKPTDSVPLNGLVDSCLAGTSVKDQMSFEEFCSWNRGTVSTTTNGQNSLCRLDPLILELRLLAGVMFGVPPTLARVEVALVTEIERRHKRRYPQSEVSRRGPRGTVWNIIDAHWYKSWVALVNKVAGTAEDSLDGRGDPQNDRARGLFRISNTSLLVENGSLAIRPDLRWKHDYELVPPLAWSALQAWYDGGPPIHRSVVKYIDNAGTSPSPHSSRTLSLATENEIELYPYFVTVYLCDSASRGQARPFQQNYQMSRVSPILVMLVQLSRELDISPDSLRLWVLGNTSGSSRPLGSDTPDEGRNDDWILSSDLNIVEQRKRRGFSKDGDLTLLLEIKDRETGLWPRGVDGKEWSFRDSSIPTQSLSDLGDGIVGLYNMGYVLL
jgi:hypothetical protein